MTLPGELARLYAERQHEIRTRLEEFATVPAEEYFYELCFCLMTPQSKAVHSNAVVQHLKHIRFLQEGGDVVTLLRSPNTYIRFHNVKATRLHLARERWPDIREVLEGERHNNPRLQRDRLSTIVNGFGLKEASHYLRNIGWRNLAIIDRHLLTNLLACGVIDRIPGSISARSYHDIEQAFDEYARHVGIPMDELDLLFWCRQTGLILK